MGANIPSPHTHTQTIPKISNFGVKLKRYILDMKWKLPNKIKSNNSGGCNVLCIVYRLSFISHRQKRLGVRTIPANINQLLLMDCEAERKGFTIKEGIIQRGFSLLVSVLNIFVKLADQIRMPSLTNLSKVWQNVPHIAIRLEVTWTKYWISNEREATKDDSRHKINFDGL